MINHSKRIIKLKVFANPSVIVGKYIEMAIRYLLGYIVDRSLIIVKRTRLKNLVSYRVVNIVSTSDM